MWQEAAIIKEMISRRVFVGRIRGGDAAKFEIGILILRSTWSAREGEDFAGACFLVVVVMDLHGKKLLVLESV